MGCSREVVQDGIRLLKLPAQAEARVDGHIFAGVCWLHAACSSNSPERFFVAFCGSMSLYFCTVYAAVGVSSHGSFFEASRAQELGD